MGHTSASHTWTIPLHVSMTVGGVAPTAGAAPASPELALREGLFGRPVDDVFERAAGRFSADALAREEFSWRNALNMALCSHVAYRSADAASRITRNRWNFEACRPIAAAGTEGFVASTADAVVVAFRGTQQVADWLINLNVSWTNVRYGAVHRGFYDAFQSVRTQLEEALTDVRAADKQIVITGHSLGGALATIAAAEWHGGHPIAGIYTFGQPAVGFTALRSFIAVRYRHTFRRFVNDDDAVARVPPGYRHVGKLYHFTGGDVRHETLSAAPGMAGAPVRVENDTPTMTQPEFRQLQSQLESARAVAPAAVNESLHSNLVQEGFFPSISDHSLDRYVGKILERI